MKKIILAFDAFKGCLSSTAVEAAVAEGIRRILPHCHIVSIPISDGGEGMLEVWTKATSGSIAHCPAHGPLLEPILAPYGISGDGQTVFIETAAVCGLPTVPATLRNPAQTTTYGMGEVIGHCLRQGFRRFVIGLGGSATNDGGAGLLQALGFRFTDACGHTIDTPLCGGQLCQVRHLHAPACLTALRESSFTAVCDVSNPLTGPQGATYVYGPQKGACTSQLEPLDQGLGQWARVMQQFSGKDIAQAPGAGAAGGLGGGLMALLNAELKPGITFTLDYLHFSQELEQADLVLTGEGKTDRQTLMGKVPYGVLQEARKKHVPVIVLSGSIEDADMLGEAEFAGLFSILQSPMDLQEAMRPDVTQSNLAHTVRQVLKAILSVPHCSLASH